MAAPQVYSTGAWVLPMQTGSFTFDNGGPQIAVMPVNVGTFTLSSGAATVANTNVTASSQILMTLKTASGTVAAPFVATITAGTGFTVSGGGSDNSTYNYAIIG